MCKVKRRAVPRVLASLALYSMVLVFHSAFAEEKRTTSPPELRVCSQNLNNFGLVRQIDTPSSKAAQRFGLVDRMANAKCDVVAVQEVYGVDEKDAADNLKSLARELSTKTKRSFDYYLGEALVGPIRNGFLLAKDIGELEERDSPKRANLPKLQPLGPGGKFTRLPFAITVLVRPKNGAPARRIILVNFHLKSKADSYKDRTKTQFEIVRMEMAEAVRELAGELLIRRGTSSIIVVLGDRNSEPNSASAELLSGKKNLADFSTFGMCKLEPNLSSSCAPSQPNRVELFRGLFTQLQQANPSQGSFRFHGKQEMIDEMLVRPNDWWIFSGQEGELRVGLEGVYGKGSDHKLLWAELNW